MSSYNIPQVKDLCEISPDVYNMSRSEQVEHLSSITEADITTARAFYARNHVTKGMSEFLRGATKRLAGNSQQAVFELRQAMGGGKTHNMIALGLLSRFPELRDLLPADITEGMGSQPARIATVNGRDVEKYIWGDIAEQLGKADEFRDHWVNGPVEMKEGDWMRLIGDEPTLIMLDELPPYFAVAMTKPVGQGTLLDILKYSLSNLYSAAMKLKRCVVVVASLDAAYDQARRDLGAQLADLKKETARGAKSITPVDLNTGEIYDILRKRLFTKLPAEGSQEIDRVVAAYAGAYKEGVRGQALSQSVEQLADEIIGSYPFHPGYKDILALFKENEKFRQTRGLIQFTANLLKGVWAKSSEEVFLVGVQYLDFSDQETRDQVKEIERSLESALANDVFDTDGSSHAQAIDAEQGDNTAAQVAALLFVASLSDNADGIRGLPADTLVEYLVAPGKPANRYAETFEELRKRCWYLHKRDGDRWYFSDVANVRKQIEDKISKIPQDRVDDEMRRRLSDVFRPKTKTAYSELVVLPRVDDVNLTVARRTCLVLSPDAKAPPAAAERLFGDVVYKNAFCVVAGDGSKMASAEDTVRRLLAIAAVRASLSDSVRNQKELEGEQKNAEMAFTSTVKSLFNTVWYPQLDGLKDVRIDLGQHQDQDGIRGEQAVEAALSSSGALKLVALDADKMDRYIQRCEDQLFPNGQSRVRWSDILERAATNTRWIWLPPEGMDELKSAALSDGRWIEENGYVDKNPPLPTPKVRVFRAGVSQSTGESELELTVSDAGRNPVIVVATSIAGLNEGKVVRDLAYRTDEVELYFQVTSSETGEVSEPVQWLGTIDVTWERQQVAGVWHVTLSSKPEAEIRWNTSGINPKDGEIYDGQPIEINGATKAVIYTYAVKGKVTAEKKFTLDAIGAQRIIHDDKPARVKSTFDFPTKGDVLRMIRAAKANPEVTFQDIRLIVGSGEGNMRLNSGASVLLTGHDIEAMIEGLRTALGDQDADLQLRCMRANFPDGFALKDFATQHGMDISIEAVEQSE